MSLTVDSPKLYVAISQLYSNSVTVFHESYFQILFRFPNEILTTLMVCLSSHWMW